MSIWYEPQVTNSSVRLAALQQLRDYVNKRLELNLRYAILETETPDTFLKIGNDTVRGMNTIIKFSSRMSFESSARIEDNIFFLHGKEGVEAINTFGELVFVLLHEIGHILDTFGRHETYLESVSLQRFGNLCQSKTTKFLDTFLELKDGYYIDSFRLLYRMDSFEHSADSFAIGFIQQYKYDEEFIEICQRIGTVKLVKGGKLK